MPQIVVGVVVERQIDALLRTLGHKHLAQVKRTVAHQSQAVQLTLGRMYAFLIEPLVELYKTYIFSLVFICTNNPIGIGICITCSIAESIERAHVIE